MWDDHCRGMSTCSNGQWSMNALLSFFVPKFIWIVVFSCTKYIVQFSWTYWTNRWTYIFQIFNFHCFLWFHQILKIFSCSKKIKNTIDIIKHCFLKRIQYIHEYTNLFLLNNIDYITNNHKYFVILMYKNFSSQYDIYMILHNNDLFLYIYNFINDTL